MRPSGWRGRFRTPRCWLWVCACHAEKAEERGRRRKNKNLHLTAQQQKKENVFLAWEIVAVRPYGHAVLFAQLSDSKLVHGGGHLFDGLLQVFRVALHQRLGDAAAAVLGGGETTHARWLLKKILPHASFIYMITIGMSMKWRPTGILVLVGKHGAGTCWENVLKGLEGRESQNTNK